MFRCMQRTNIYLDDRQLTRLDRLAAGEGVSRAEVIRRIVDRALADADDDLAADLAAIDASFGVAPGLAAPALGTGERDGRLARLWRAAP